jgi:hypothetical protein
MIPMKTPVLTTQAPLTEHGIAAGARLALLFAALASLMFRSHVQAQDSPAAPTNAAVTPTAGGPSLEDQERQIDKQHMRTIYDAMQAYKKKNGDLPNWLSDLFPEFLSDPGVLMSPVELRTGDSVLWNYADPKMRTSYVYEFSQAGSGTPGDQGKELTLKEKKILQMQEYGPVVPLLRCHLHHPILNLSYSGDIYETELFWETDPNTRALMAKLGPGPGPKDARKMRLLVRDAASGQPLKEADIRISKLMAMSLPVPPRNLKTDADGQCEINLVTKNPESLALRIGQAGYVTLEMEWLQGDIPTEWTAKLEKVTPAP